MDIDKSLIRLMLISSCLFTCRDLALRATSKLYTTCSTPVGPCLDHFISSSAQPWPLSLGKQRQPTQPTPPSPLKPLSDLFVPQTAPPYRSLPAPLHNPISSFSDSTTAQSQAQDLLLTQQKQRKSLIPVYGQRKGWKPTTEEDFGDGGAFPECWSAQYPLDMGRKKVGVRGRWQAM